MDKNRSTIGSGGETPETPGGDDHYQADSWAPPSVSPAEAERRLMELYATTPPSPWRRAGQPPAPEFSVEEAASYCRSVAPHVLAQTAMTATDPDASPSERLAAGKVLLERGYGRPNQQLSIEGNVDVTHLHLEAVRELAGRARGQVIDLVSSYEEGGQDAPEDVQDAPIVALSSDDATKDTGAVAPARYPDTAQPPDDQARSPGRRRVKRRKT